MPITARALAFLAALTLVPVGAFALLPDDRGGPRPARAQSQPGTPGVPSPNVKHLTSRPGTAAISGVFSRSAPFFYVSGGDSVTVFDVKDPRNPVQVGKLVNAVFENEAMTLGERVLPDGSIQRFVLIGNDLADASISPDGFKRGRVGGRQLIVVDVTDPTTPKIVGMTPESGPDASTTGTHTMACMNSSCTIAYSSGSGAGTTGKFSIFDLSDLTKPRQVKEMQSPGGGPNPVFGASGHYWNVDGSGIAWHTGSGGAAAFDITDPLNPLALNGTDENGTKTPYNDFIHHNSQRPNALAFSPGSDPSVVSGNVLLVTEEDYANEGDEVVCDRSGTFQTWEVPDLDGAAYRARNPGLEPNKGTIRVLDTLNAPSEGGGGATTPVGGFCSAHWFDFHPAGIVAIGHYQQGLRLIDVRNPRDIKQFGYFTGGATQVWDAYWAPTRDENGAAVPGRKTNLVYTVDAVRGVEVFEVTNMPEDLPISGDSGGRGPFPTPPTKPGEETRPGEEFGAVPGSSGGARCPGPTSRFTRGSRLTSSGLRLRGTSIGRGCAVRRMAVAVGRKTGKACRFLRADGRFGARRSCLRTQYLPAKGTTKWTLNRKVRLPRGSYLVWSRAVNTRGDIEKKANRRNLLRTRVR